MKYFVTGGYGFIGSNFIHYMFRKYGSNIEIVNIDKLTYAANTENLSLLPGEIKGNYVFEHADITNRETMEMIFNKYRPDYVINFAAETHVDRSIENPSVFLSTNIQGTQVLMDLSLKYETKRYHQVSTDEVYGSLENNNEFFTEKTPVDPRSPYSASKCAADMLCKSYGNTYRLPYTISRCSNNYGPCQNPEKLIPKIINKVLNGEKIPIYGDGENIRDWLYVVDHCEAIDKIIHYSDNGKTYNIGGNNEWNNIEIVKKIISIINQKHPQLNFKKKSYDDYIEFVEDRKGHDRRYAIDSSKLMQELHWKPKSDFEQTLENTINWYIKYSDYYFKNV